MGTSVNALQFYGYSLMFSIIDRYLGRAILSTTLLVLLTLVALAGIFEFVGELEDVGQGAYGAASAAQYVLLTLPGKAYLLFAPSVLLGSLLGLGTLANNSELTVMRAAGISPARIIRAVLITGIGLMVLVVLLGETLMPRTEQLAEQLRLTAQQKQLSVRSRTGLWVKSSNRYVNVSTVLPDFSLLDVNIHEFSRQQLLRAVQIAKAKPLEDTNWQLDGVDITRFGPSDIQIQRIDRITWHDLEKEFAKDDQKTPSKSPMVSPDVLKSLSISPESLSARDLYQQVTYLQENDLNSKEIELAMWVKLTSPLASLVMLMLSLPFVFGSQRAGGAGQKIFIGIMLGIVYVLLNRLLTQLALANGLSPLASALIPLFGFLLIAIIGIRKTA